ncbi:SDR family NAD(P)-dependent oxidoreductase, partial [Solihabitans fulvus]
VRFADGINALTVTGVGVVLELGPGGVLSALGRGVAADTIDFIPTLREGREEPESLLDALAQAHTAGVPVDWRAYFAGQARHTDLPTYAFQRQRYWLDAGHSPTETDAPAGATDPRHPFLSAAVPLAHGDGVLLTGRLSLTAQPWLADHAMLGTVLLPGTAFVDLALRAGAHVGCDRIDELIQEAPLILPADGGVQLQLSVDGPDDSASRAFRIHSRHDTPAGRTDVPWTRHASGVLSQNTEAEPPVATPWPPTGATPTGLADWYDRLADRGYSYGPAFQGLTAVWRRGDDLFAEVRLPDDCAENAADHDLHPALLDAALHSLAATADETDGTALPFSWTGVTRYATGASTLRAHLTRPAPDTVSVTATDESGMPILTVEALVRRPVSAAQLRPTAGADNDSMFRQTWSPLPATDPEPVGAVAFLGVDDPAWTAALGVPATGYPDLAALRAAIAAGHPAPAVVLAPLDHDNATPGAIPDAAEKATHAALALIQEWLADQRLEASRLVLVTRRAVVVQPGDGPPDLATAPVWGLARSAQTEHPNTVVLFDVDGLPESYRAVHAALASGEPQLAVRAGRTHLPRLARGVPPGLLAAPDDATAWRLDVTARGTLDNLRLVPAQEALAPLQPGQVRVAVRAAGLNFRDVLIALDMYPGAASLGSEGAGIVMEVGPEVTGLAVGDRVAGLFTGAFGPVAVADHRVLSRFPAAWTFAQAASVPTTFLTAYYGLVDLADVRPGESVLVHAAAGGVGMAAGQLLKHLGAEPYGTASRGKWHVLRAQGLADDHIASSRTLDFRDQFLAATNGRGVDVVLNSLAGEFVDASLSLLPRGGRFLEMGKTDLRERADVQRDHPTVRYQAYDLMEAGPERIGRLLAEVMDLFDRGVLDLPPITTWDIRRAPEAFRHLQQARNIGKVVLTVPVPLDRDGTVLVSGGLGALGGLVARHLVAAHGVRHLTLLGRAGVDTSGLVGELTALGAEVTVAACDIADRAAVEKVLAVAKKRHPLVGVVHAAGVLDDGLVSGLSSNQVGRVFRPKVSGGWLLHELTRDLDLAFFALFSSASGTLGGGGQGGYAAANVFLDALATYRSSFGLPAVSLAWGPWGDRDGLGLAAATGTDRPTRGGAVGLSPAEGLALFDTALTVGEPVLVPLRLDQVRLRAEAAAGQIPSVLNDLVRAPTGRRSDRGVTTSGAATLRHRLAGLPDTERGHVLLELVRGHVATVLGHAAADTIEPQRSLKDLGFDSLAAVELRNRLNTATGLRLPPALAFDYPTPAALADHLRTELSGDAAPEGEPRSTAGAETDLSDTELRRLLATIPPARLREARLTDVLLRLAEQGEDRPAPTILDRVRSIDQADVADLISMALDHDTHQPPTQ